MNNGTNGHHQSRIDFLKQRQREIAACLVAENLKRQKREKRELDKLDAVLGCRVRKAAAASPDFRRMVIKAALLDLDDKTKIWLAERGWSE